MLRYITLLLLVSVVASLPQKKYVHASKKSSYQGTFAIADYTEDHSLHELHVRVRLYNNTYISAKSKDCIFKFDTRPEVNSTDAVVSSLTIVGVDKVVLAWYDELDEPNSRQTRVVTLDMSSCEERSWGKAQPDALSGNVIVVPEKHNEFRIFTDDKEACRGYGDRCRIGYSLNNRYIGVKSSFDVDLDMSSMNIEYLANRDLIVSGFKGANYYEVTRVRYRGYTDPIYAFSEFRRMQLKSSGESFCHTNDGILVVCALYDDCEYKYYSKPRMSFPKETELVDMYVIRKGEFMLLTRNKDCAGRADCRLYATRVREGDDNPKHEMLNFSCGDDQRDVAVLGVEEFKFGLAYLPYACRNGDDYTFMGLFL